MLNLFKHKHNWQLTYSVGDFHRYHCKSNKCIENRYTIETRSEFTTKNPGKKNMKYVWVDGTTTELTAEEAASYITKAEASISATMWILDNVEPTVSAGREDNIDYKYKTENGKIVEK